MKLEKIGQHKQNYENKTDISQIPHNQPKQSKSLETIQNH
jgi:hypothetical protein